MKAAFGFAPAYLDWALGRLTSADPASAHAQLICTGAVGWGLFKEALVEQKQKFPTQWEGIEEARGDAAVAETLQGGKVDYEPLGKQRAQGFLLSTCAVIFGIAAFLGLLFAFLTVDPGLVRTVLTCVTVVFIAAIKYFSR